MVSCICVSVCIYLCLPIYRFILSLLLLLLLSSSSLHFTSLHFTSSHPLLYSSLLPFGFFLSSCIHKLVSPFYSYSLSLSCVPFIYMTRLLLTSLQPLSHSLLRIAPPSLPSLLFASQQVITLNSYIYIYQSYNSIQSLINHN